MDTPVLEPAAPKETSQADEDLRSLAAGAVVIFLGKLARGARLGFLLVVGWLCGLDVVGLYSLAWGMVATLNKVARFGLVRGVVRFVIGARTTGCAEEAERALATALRVGLLASMAVATATWLSADAIAGFYEKPIAGAVRIMAWSAPFLTAAWVFLAAIRARRIMRYEVYVMSIAGPLILLVGGLAIGLAGWGLRGVAWVQLAMAVGCCLLAATYFRNFYALGKTLRPRAGGRDWKALIKFSLPVMLADLMTGLLTQLDVLMLGKFTSATEVGIYALARRTADSMLKAPQALDPIFSSVVSELAHQDRHEEIGHRFAVISRWVLMINLPIFAALFIVGESLLPLLAAGSQAASELQVGLQILFVLCVGKLAQGAFALVEPLLAMSGRPALNMYNNGVWLASNFALNIWLIGKFGVFGAAVGATASVLIVNVIRLVQIRLLHGIRPFERSQVKPLLAAAAAALVALLVRGAGGNDLATSTVAQLVVFLAVYAGALKVLRLEPEDRALLGRMVGRLRKAFG